MELKLDKIELYPSVLDKSMSENARNSSCVGVGWFPSVIELYETLYDIHPDFVIEQVKEKFGVLRFYISNYPDNSAVRVLMINAIQAGEDNTSTICDVCGEEGKTQKVNEYLIATRCDKHITPKVEI